MDGKNNSVGIQRLKKEHEDGIFELIGEKNIGYCKTVKKDWDKKNSVSKNRETDNPTPYKFK